MRRWTGIGVLVVSLALACLEASKRTGHESPIRGVGETVFGADVPSGGVCHI